MKIHIIGCSGSGKSYLARKLSEKYCIPHFDLDDLQWDNHAEHYGVKMPPEKRSAMLQEIVQKENWIIEGVYYKWVQDSFRAADMIYVLEIPSRVYKFRILRRFFQAETWVGKGKERNTTLCPRPDPVDRRIPVCQYAKDSGNAKALRTESTISAK